MQCPHDNSLSCSAHKQEMPFSVAKCDNVIMFVVKYSAGWISVTKCSLINGSALQSTTKNWRFISFHLAVNNFKKWRGISLIVTYSNILNTNNTTLLCSNRLCLNITSKLVTCLNSSQSMTPSPFLSNFLKAATTLSWLAACTCTWCLHTVTGWCRGCLYCTILYFFVLYCTSLYYTVLYSTLIHYTVL